MPYVQCSDCLSTTKNVEDWFLKAFACQVLTCCGILLIFFHNHQPAATTGTYSEKSHIILLPTVDLSGSIKSHCNIFRVTVHSGTKLAKFSIETPYITFDHALYIKRCEISTSLQMVFVIHLSGFQLLMSFFGTIASVMQGLGLKVGLEIIYAPVASTGHILPESAIFELILSNATPEDFITSSFQTED